MTPHTLVLLRHGTAEPARSGQRDADRRLSDRGVADARAAGEWLERAGLTPALVLCSPARRTVQTWEAVAAVLGRPATGTTGGASAPPVTFEPRLYTASVETVLGLVTALPDELPTAMIVGHNPTISLTSALLAPPFDGRGLETTGIAVHQADTPWAAWRREGAPLTRAHTARAVIS